MVITFGAEKGGVGKSRLATNIAALAACNGVDVVLLDTDKQGSATSWSRIRNEEGILPSIPVFALPPQPARELANLSSRYTLVVVDIGAQNYRTMLECSLLSDIVIVPCGPDQQEIESTVNVLTRVSTVDVAKATMEVRDYLREEGISVFNAQIAQRASWLASGKSGRALHELNSRDRSQKATEEVQAVYDEILKRINARSK